MDALLGTVSWLFGCTAFSDVESMRDWVIHELKDNEHPLVFVEHRHDPR